MSKHKLYVLVFISLAVISCKKKYPEDNGRSLIKPESRIIAKWKMTDYQYNGESKSDFILSTKGIDINNIVLDIHRDNSTREQYINCTAYYNGSSIGSVQKAFGGADNIALPGGNAISSFLFVKPLATSTIVLYDPQPWRITKLYKSELRMVFDTDSGQFKMFFKK